MSLDGAITNLASWAGNTMMPTMAGLFFAGAVYRYSKGGPFEQPSVWRLRLVDVLGDAASSRRVCAARGRDECRCVLDGHDEPRELDG